MANGSRHIPLEFGIGCAIFGISRKFASRAEQLAVYTSAKGQFAEHREYIFGKEHHATSFLPIDTTANRFATICSCSSHFAGSTALSILSWRSRSVTPPIATSCVRMGSFCALAHSSRRVNSSTSPLSGRLRTNVANTYIRLFLHHFVTPINHMLCFKVAPQV
jgi:hypothetical protein